MKKLLLTTLLILLLPVSWAGATDAHYYVRTTAAGAGNGSSFANAWAIADIDWSAVNTKLSTDNVYIYFKRGDTFGQMSILGNGTYVPAENGYRLYITVDPVDTGNKPLFTISTAINVGNYAIRWRNAGYITLDNLNITDTGSSDSKSIGISSGDDDGGSTANLNNKGYIHITNCDFNGFGHYAATLVCSGDHVVVTDNTFTGCANGIYFIDEADQGGNYHYIANNTGSGITGYTKGGTQIPADGHLVGLQGTSYSIIENNIDVGGRAPYIIYHRNVVDDLTLHNVFRNNTGRNNLMSTVTFASGYVAGGACYGNLAYRNISDNASIQTDYATARSSLYINQMKPGVAGNRMFNNTVYDGDQMGIKFRRAVDYCYFKNNIVWIDGRTVAGEDYLIYFENSADTGANHFIDYNLYWTTIGDPSAYSIWGDHNGVFYPWSTWKSSRGNDTNSPNPANPLMTDPVNQDYTLQSTSTARDAGGYLSFVDYVSSGSGSSATIVVDDPYWFHGHMGVTDSAGAAVEGMLVSFYDATNGLQNREITSINYGTKTLTLSSSIDYIYNAASQTNNTTNTQISLRFVGTHPDIGVEEFASPPTNTAPYVTVYSPGGNITIYHDVADTITASCTAVDDESDTITYLWTLPNSDKDASTLEDPGTVTFTCGAYPCSHSCSLKVTDEHGLYNTYSFTVTHNETSVDSHADITFWWRAENSDTLDAKLDYSAGDTTAERSGAAAVYSSTQAKHGTYSLYCANGDDDAVFDIASIYDGGQISMGAWVYISTWVDAAPILDMTELAGDYDYVRITLTDSNDVRFQHKLNTVATTFCQTTGSAMTTNAWFYVYGYFNPTTDVHGLKVYNSALELVDSDTDTTDLTAISVASGQFRVGISLAYNAAMYVDDPMVSNDSTRELNLIADKDHYPATPVCTKIYAVTANGTYGIDDALVIATEFDRPNDVNTVGGLGYLTVETGANDLKLEYLSGDNTTVLQWGTTASAGYKIIAAMVSADLAISGNITLNGMTMTGSEDLSTYLTGGSLAANSAIVIDTTAPSISAFFHCNSSKVQIDAETTYVAGETCYLCVQSDGDTIFFNDGPLSNVKIGTDMAYPDKEEFEYYAGIGTTILQFARVIQIGDRDLDLQAEGTAGGTGLIHGATKLIDGGSNEITYTLPQADLAGGNIIISVPYPSTSPKEFDATNTMATYLAAGGYFVANDFIECTEANSIGTADMSASDGTAGNVITIDGGGFAHAGTHTFGDYYVIKNCILE